MHWETIMRWSEAHALGENIILGETHAMAKAHKYNVLGETYAVGKAHALG